MKILEKSMLKILKRGCRTQYDLSISSLSLVEAPSVPPLRFARILWSNFNYDIYIYWVKGFAYREFLKFDVQTGCKQKLLIISNFSESFIKIGAMDDVVDM